MVVAVVNRFFWRRGAVPSVARGWADNLEKAGHRVVVFASDVSPDQDTPTRSYLAVRLGGVKWFDAGAFAFAWRLARALLRERARRPDAILCLDSTAYFGAWLAGRLLRIPAIMAFQGWVYSPGKRGLYPKSAELAYKLSVHFCARLAPAIGCLSREIEEGLRVRGARPERLWYAPNCIDLEFWKTDKTAPHERQEKIILYVGRFSREKGLRYLLEALPQVVRRVPSARAVLVGGEEGEDGPFHLMARRLGVASHVEFAGILPRDRLPPVYANADILVFPSLAEGHPLTPMEALGCGTPVVASDIPGLNETIEHEVNGLLVPPADPRSLAEAICRVLSDRALLERLTRAARPSVARFAWERRIAELEAFCERLPRPGGRG